MARQQAPEAVNLTNIALRVKAVEDALQRIVEIQQANHVELRKAFHMTDAHIWVLRKIAEDMAKGEVVIAAETKQLDFQYYIDEFNALQEEQAKKAEAEQKAAIEAAEKKAEEEAEKEANQGAEAFGGDQHVASP